MNLLMINEDRIIWVTLVISLMIHGLIFALSGRTFIQHAQFSVRPSARMVEVSIEEENDTVAAAKNIITQAVVEHKKISSKPALQSISGVKVKANPDYFQNPPPEYPELAKQMRQEGLVMLAVDVDREGCPIKVDILKSSGFHLLDQAALKAVGHWKFQPGRIGSIPIESTATVPIRFQLEK
jgi:TonB family protein